MCHGHSIAWTSSTINTSRMLLLCTGFGGREFRALSAFRDSDNSPQTEPVTVFPCAAVPSLTQWAERLTPEKMFAFTVRQSTLNRNAPQDVNADEITRKKREIT